MKLLITASRLRSAIADARTEKDIEMSLRAHKIRFSYDTSSGILAFRVPTVTGSALIIRTASRSAPFRVLAAAPAPAVAPVPVLHPDCY